MDTKQNVCVFSRKRIELSEITEVLGFSDGEITLLSSLGMIAIEGQNLKIENFSAETGQLFINGDFDGLYYFKGRDEKEKHGFLSGLFK